MAMIKNLITQLNPGGLIKIGKKGKMITSAKGNEFRPPKKLDHFQLTTTEKDENGDYIVDVDLQNKIKNDGTGLMDKNGCLVGIPIRLLYNDTELNFPNRYASYVSGKLSCTGDGETATKRVDNFEKKHSCPCQRIEPGYDGNDKCKPVGNLICIIDEAGLFGQAHKFTTTSMNSIKGILGGIELIRNATGGKIAGLPLMLTMNAKQTTTPQGINATVYVISICFRGTMSDLRQEMIQLAATEKQYLVEIDNVSKENSAINDDEEKELIEEFFPEAVVVDKKDIAVEEVKDKKETDKQEDHSPATAPPISDNEQEKDDDENEIYGVLKPAGSYERLYNRFILEKDLEKACNLAKRLQRGHLLFWIIENYQDIDVDPKIKKPELLLIVKNILNTVLAKTDDDDNDNIIDDNAAETNAAEIIDTPDTDSENKKTEIKENPRIEYSQLWDNSGRIKKSQLRQLVKLKLTLEEQGVLRPEKWETHVNYFLDKEGGKISKAINLTKTQGDTFIEMLEKNIKTD